MSLFANFFCYLGIYFHGLLFSLALGCIFYLLACLLIFDWMPRIVSHIVECLDSAVLALFW